MYIRISISDVRSYVGWGKGSKYGLKGTEMGGKASDAASRLEVAVVGRLKLLELTTPSGA
jgi:hypothetical protein